jgi:predicted ATPase/signal transduction histidine kinase
LEVDSELHETPSQELREIHRGRRFVLYRSSGRDGIPIVIKAILPERPDAFARLRHEYEILSVLDVEGVAKPIGFHTATGAPALILEDAGPMNLKEALGRHALGLEAFLDLAIQLAEIVQRVHERNVIHRDIGSVNIVVSADWRLTLVDFEAAVTERVVVSGAEIEGELPYVAPEQTGRMQRPVDHRADLYSVGATFYEMLTGAPPFPSHDPVATIHAHLARTPLPPSTARPEVPSALSDIVLKLLAKMPEDRYQSAEAVAADLRHVQQELESTGRISPFELGQLDLTRELPFPEKLYGRERELAELEAAFDRVSAGGSEVVLVSGVAGIGKSALALELRRPVEARGAWFAFGKFDLRHSNMPYAPIADAFRGRVLAILDEPEPVIETWRQRIRDALGRIGGVLSAVIPELERLVGRCPAPPQLGPQETENRFYFVLRAFIDAIASRERPLVLVVDDLQWADLATLKLFHFIATAADLRFVLLLGAFRSEEVGPDYLAGIPCRRIELGALDVEALTALCCDALGCSRTRGAALAALLHQKTAGNPFFVLSLLRYLQKSELLIFDDALNTWVWHQSRIEKLGVTDNVGELLASSFRKLPRFCQEALEVAACIGNRFCVPLLASVQGQTIPKVERALRIAVRENFLTTLPDASYRFIHDKVQQTALSMLGERERQDCHLRIGRRLVEGAKEAGLDERLFDIVDHLDVGSDRITDFSERLELAELNRRAGRRCRASSAYGGALDYFRMAMGLLPGDTWTIRHDLAFQIYRDAIEAAEFTGASGEGLFETAWDRADSNVERAELCSVRLVAETVKGELHEAIRWGERGLALFGFVLPSSGASEEARAEIAAVRSNLRGRAIDELVDAPLMQGPDELASVRLLANLIAPIYLGKPELFPFVTSRIVNLSLLHGNTVYSPFGYATYSIVAWVDGDYTSSWAFGRLALDLTRRFDDPAQECVTVGVVAAVVNTWRKPLRSSVTLLRHATAKAFECGNFQFANYWSMYAALFLFQQGVEFSQLLSEIERALVTAAKTHAPTGTQFLHLLRHTIRRLQGSELDDEPLIAEDGFVISQSEILRLQRLYLFRDFPRAVEMASVIDKHTVSVPANPMLANDNFYASLTFAAACDGATLATREAHLARIANNQRRLAAWAITCPENFQHKHVLVSAEVARLEGRFVEAGTLYDEAIDAASKEGVLCDEALAKELAGRFYHAQGRKWIAALYLSLARQTYARWGATAKVDALDKQFPSLEGVEPVAHSAGVPLDLLGILKAAETISREVKLDRLLEKLMELTLALAGAERSVLLIEEGGRLLVRATGAVGEPTSLVPMSLETSPHVPRAIVEHVRTTAEVVVLEDATRGPFADDEYVSQHGVKSVFALPIRGVAKLNGILYLENNVASRVFTADRVRVLSLLSAQIGVSLENSLLFEKLRQEIDERTHAEAALRFLADSGMRLAETLDYEATLGKVVALAVPFLADECAIDITYDGLPRRVTTGSLPDARPGLVVPLQASGRTLGTMTFYSKSNERRYGPTHVALAEEIARRAAVAIENARLYDEARAAVRARDEFLSIASHELKTPITSLQLLVQGLKAGLVASTPETLGKTYQVAERQTRRLTRLIDGLLDVSRCSREKMSFQLEQVDLAAVARDTAEGLREDLARAGCELVLNAATPVVGRWDRSRLEQVISNLLSNAIKFGAGKPIELTTETRNGSGVLLVSDHGIGIPAEQLQNIFGRFHRAVPSTQYGGLGLGLYISRDIVNALGGSIHAESTLGSGSTFTVELPLSR